MSKENEKLDALEDLPEVKEVLAKIRDLESKIQKQVNADSWALLVEWEELWVQYVGIAARYGKTANVENE